MYKPSGGAKRRSDSRLGLGNSHRETEYRNQHASLSRPASQHFTTTLDSRRLSRLCIWTPGESRLAQPPAQAISPMTACRLFLYMTYPDRQSGDSSVVVAFETKPVSLLIKITTALIGLYFSDHEVWYDMMARLPWALGVALRL